MERLKFGLYFVFLSNMVKQLFLVCFLISFCSYAQHQDKVDFISAEGLIEPIPKEKTIKGTMTYKFKIVQNVDSIYLDAKKMNIDWIYLDTKRHPYIYNDKTISIHKSFKKGDIYELVIKYSCKPKQTVYFLGWEDAIIGNEQIWTQGQGKYTSHWLPSFDDMEEKVEFDLEFKLPNDIKTIISNGKQDAKDVVDSSYPDKQVVSFDMKKPMSSYLVAFAIGNYDKKELKSASGVPIELYYEPKDSLKVEPTYRYTKQIFDFLEEENVSL